MECSLSSIVISYHLYRPAPHPAVTGCRQARRPLAHAPERGNYTLGGCLLAKVRVDFNLHGALTNPGGLLPTNGRRCLSPFSTGSTSKPVRHAHGAHLLRLLRGSVALESETSVEGCSPPAPRCGSALSLPRQRLARRSGTSATPQETALSGAFFRLSSGCLSTRLRREQSRQQLVSCSFPRETWANTHLRETRLGPNVPAFLVGLRKAALLGSPHRWLGIGLRVSLFLSFRSSEGSSLRPSLILLFGRSAVLLQRRVQVWAQRFHRVCSPCGVRNQRSVTPCSSSRTGGRSTVYGQRFQRLHRVQPCNFSFPVCSCLFVLQLHFLAFSAAFSCFFQLLFQLSPRLHSRRRPRHQAQPNSGDF